MIGTILAAATAALHLYILWLEMFRWEAPRTRAAFGGIPAELAAQTRSMAANQGLYNGFLAAALIWGIARGPEGRGMIAYGLICVAVADVYGAATVSRRILFIQTIPAVLALLALWRGF